MKISNILGLLAALSSSWLSGCALVAQQYPAPTGDRTSFLRVVKQGTQSLPPKTSVFTFAKAETCEGRMWIYNEVRPSQENVMPNGFVSIESGKPFSLMVIHTTNIGIELGTIKAEFCAPVITFVPVTGLHYVAEEFYAGNQCYLRLISAESNSMRGAQVVPVQKKKFTRGFDESSSWCKSE